MRPEDVKTVKSPPRSVSLWILTINIFRHQYFLSSHHNIRGHNKYFSVEWWNIFMCGIFSADKNVFTCLSSLEHARPLTAAHTWNMQIN